jgi:CheY-like chemotaxis protein
VVEDDAGVRALAELVLRRAGHDVVAASSPYAAIAAVKAQTDIELALIDIVIPDMTGFDLASEIRRLAPWVRIVYMSGFTSDQFREPVDEPFVAKPFTVKALTQAVEQALSG